MNSAQQVALKEEVTRKMLNSESREVVWGAERTDLLTVTGH
jgi:hypothetical protein